MGGRGSFLLSPHFFFSFFTTHTIISVSFHFGSTNIAARGGRGVERAEKAEVVGWALAWPVIREADPALSLHCGKQSKQEFTMAGLSAPFTHSFPTSARLSGRMCLELLQAILPLLPHTHGILPDFSSSKQHCCKRSKIVLKKTTTEERCIRNSEPLKS